MSKKPNKKDKTSKKMVQKTLAGKIIIWTLVALMALGSIGSLIVALIQILSK